MTPAFKFGHEILGPIFHNYCYRLWVALRAYDGRDAVCLYITRGGLRQKLLYRLFLENRGLDETIPSADLYSSRIAAAKGCLTSDFDHVHKILAGEFYNNDMGYLITSVFPQHADDPCCLRPSDLDPEFTARRATWAEFTAAYHAPNEIGEKFRRYFDQQAALMDEHVRGLIGTHRHILLVDTGWAGTIQAMLMRKYPDRDWLGLYFARWNRTAGWPWHMGSVVGLSLDNVQPGKNPAIQALFEYHHLIESPLEPDVPSVAGYKRNGEGLAVADVWPYDMTRMAPQPGEDMFAGIVDYITAAPQYSAAEIVRRNFQASRRLRRLIRYPSSADVIAMSLPPRSADFGRDVRVPIFPALTVKDDPAQNVAKIRQSLWKQGQIVRTYPHIHYLLNLSYNLSRRNKIIAKYAGRFMSYYLKKH